MTLFSDWNSPAHPFSGGADHNGANPLMLQIWFSNYASWQAVLAFMIILDFLVLDNHASYWPIKANLIWLTWAAWNWTETLKRINITGLAVESISLHVLCFSPCFRWSAFHWSLQRTLLKPCRTQRPKMQSTCKSQDHSTVQLDLALGYSKIMWSSSACGTTVMTFSVFWCSRQNDFPIFLFGLFCWL